MDIGDMRRDFESDGLDRDQLDDNPIQQFQTWFEDARKANILEPNAMSLATAGNDCMPDLRTVLLKYFDDNGFVFYTNYGSRKAREMEQNPQAALLFPWLGLNRQVRIQGKVEKVSTRESLRYFASRPRGSQIGGIPASPEDPQSNCSWHARAGRYRTGRRKAQTRAVPQEFADYRQCRAL